MLSTAHRVPEAGLAASATTDGRPLAWTSSTPPDPGSTPTPHDAPARTTGRSASIQTFIVEDSAIILDNLTASLEELAPVTVVGTAGDEVTAIERINERARDLDLVIIDVFLKSGSGLGVLRSAMRSGLSAKCVVLTNFATNDMRQTCHSLGADRVFDKSNEIDDLISYCTDLAEGSA